MLFKRYAFFALVVFIHNIISYRGCVIMKYYLLSSLESDWRKLKEYMTDASFMDVNGKSMLLQYHILQNSLYPLFVGLSFLFLYYLIGEKITYLFMVWYDGLAGWVRKLAHKLAAILPRNKDFQ